MFDLIKSSVVGSAETPHQLQDYDALILSNIVDMDDNFISLIDNYVKHGGKLLVTGFPGINDGAGNPINKIRLQSLGVMPDYEVFAQAQSTYLKLSVNDKSALGQNEFKDFDLIMMYSGFLKCKTRGNAESYLKLVPHTSPEKVYFADSDVSDFPGIVANSFGEGRAVFIPWLIGTQYGWKGNNGQRALFVAALENLLHVESALVTDASPLIEMTHLGNRNGVFEWIGMINHSGQIGDVFREPVPIYNIAIRFKPVKPINAIKLMRSGEELKFNQKDGWVECVVPKVGDFEMMLCLYN